MGEAHRHEPPVPHDKVVVDEGEDREEPVENERSSKHEEEKAPGGKAQMALPLPDSERERLRQDQVLEVAGGLPEDPWKVPEGNGQPAIEPVKEDQGPGDGGLQPGPQAVPPEGQDAPAAGAAERAGGVPLPGRAAGAAGKLVDKSEPGGCRLRLPWQTALPKRILGVGEGWAGEAGWAGLLLPALPLGCPGQHADAREQRPLPQLLGKPRVW